MNVSDQNGAKMANISSLAIYFEKAKIGRSRDFFFDSSSAGALADGGCFGSVLLRRVHNIHILERINLYPKEWFVCIVKEVCWLFGVSAQC